MPPILNKKLAGLPTWAWLALTAAGVGVGLYLRSKASPGSEDGVSEDPCDQESPAYNPEACEAGKPVERNAEEYGIEEGASNGVVPQYPGVGGVGGSGGSGQYQPYEPEPMTGLPATYPSEAGEVFSPNAHELGTAEEGGVETGSSTTVKIEVAGHDAHSNKGCSQKKKPKTKKGYKIVCQGNKWAYEPVNAKHKPKAKHKKGSHHLTGGGSPDKPHNKASGITGHGKHQKHKAKH